MKKIISCSRRTDVPAFYSEWFLNRVRAGYCHTFNPFGGQVYRVSLLPEDVLAFAFWTRNPAPLLPALDELDQRGYTYFFNMTVTGYPKAIEPFNPALETSIANFQKLSDRLGPWRVQWRYDPIILSTATPPAYHLERFEGIARRLEGYTDHCTFSFVDYYGKTRRNLGRVERQTGIRFLQPSLEEQGALLDELAEVGAAHGIRLYSCCGDALASGKVLKNRCIDPDLVRRLAPGLDEYPGQKPTREECGCMASVDIGVYDTCLFGCTYCYATNDRPAAQRRHAAHDPGDSALWRPEELRGGDLEELARR